MEKSNKKRKIEASEDVKKKTKLNDNTKICNICFEELGSNNYSITKCGHSFCNECFLESLSRKKECPCCRSDIFDIHKNKKKMCFNRANMLATKNLRYVLRPEYMKLIKDSFLNMFENTLSFKCRCGTEVCSNSMNYEENEKENILNSIKNITEKRVFKYYLASFVKDFSFQNSIRQNLITKNFYEE